MIAAYRRTHKTNGMVSGELYHDDSTVNIVIVSVYSAVRELHQLIQLVHRYCCR